MKYIIATHGKMASGIKNTIEMLTGKKEDIFALDAYVETQELRKEFEKLLATCDGEGIYVFTDIVSGSVNQEICRFLERPHFHVITGVNLPLIMELVFRNENLSDEEIMSIVEEAKDQIIYMNKMS